jgi:methenyltetrahydromethanopterin cyclohydrolase
MEWTTYIPRCPLCNSREVYECVITQEAYKVSVMAISDDRLPSEAVAEHSEDTVHFETESTGEYYCKACDECFDQPTLERVKRE